MSARDRWRSEMESAWLYRSVADTEKDPGRAGMFRALATAAEAQAAILLGDLRREGIPEPSYRPSARARIVARLAQRFGVRHAAPLLAAMKVRGLSVYELFSAPAHAGERHRSAQRGGSLRAAVFGFNDGLVSNTCLILGVAGASDSPSLILATGVAGLLAGAFSMAAGEWVSVRTQREMYERQIGEEREELARYPEEEAEELALIYQGRGIPLEEARAMATRVLADPEQALATLAREELGLNPDNLGSPWRAAWASFAAFAAGAIVPLLPFLWGSTEHGIGIAAALAASALFVVGGILSLFSGRNAWLGALRMLAIGAAAGGATFGIGRLLHASL